MSDFSFPDMFRRLLTAEGQSRTARTVELFGWLILIEGPLIVLAPHFSASVLNLPPLTGQGATYFRLMGMLVGGIGMLYVASARLNAMGFVFASLLDRPLGGAEQRRHPLRQLRFALRQPCHRLSATVVNRPAAIVNHPVMVRAPRVAAHHGQSLSYTGLLKLPRTPSKCAGEMHWLCQCRGAAS